MYHWVFNTGDDVPRLTDDVLVSGDRITAIEFLIGGNSLVVGTARGEVTSWFRAAPPDGAEAMIKAHVYEPQGASVLGFAPSPRGCGASGSLEGVTSLHDEPDGDEEAH